MASIICSNINKIMIYRCASMVDLYKTPPTKILQPRIYAVKFCLSKGTQVLNKNCGNVKNWVRENAKSARRFMS